MARRARTGSRAIAGGFAISFAVVMIFAAWLATRPGRPVPYLVAGAPLAAGTRLGGADLRTSRLRLPASVSGIASSRRASLAGRTLAVSLRPGELVTVPELAPRDAQPAIRPVPVEVPAYELSGLVPGEGVDVFLTTGSAGSSHTALILRGAEVLEVPSSNGGGGGVLGGGGGSGSEVAVLGVPSLGDVESLVAAAHAGTMDLVVAEPSDGHGPGTGGSGGSG